MLSDLPFHRVIIFAILGFVAVSIVTQVRWENVVILSSQIVSSPDTRLSTSANQLEANSTGQESKEARRERLKDDALRLGSAVLNPHCDLAAKHAYSVALTALAQQRLSDMGCSSTLLCNMEKGFREVSYKFYATDKDRNIANQLREIVHAGVIAPGELGAFQFLIGHPDELTMWNTAGGGFSSSPPCAAN